ncbi:helix-turn-helix domain-containing protein [Planotetraspora phitsanulokensis]|nr:helix-turn-helix domain-containing protein [Planotetraspora phitsanulokensis]
MAAVARVSVATASKALNGRFDVRETTRRLVLDASAQLTLQPTRRRRACCPGRPAPSAHTGDLVGRFGITVLLGEESAFGSGEMAVLLAVRHLIATGRE